MYSNKEWIRSEISTTLKQNLVGAQVSPNNKAVVEQNLYDLEARGLIGGWTNLEVALEPYSNSLNITVDIKSVAPLSLVMPGIELNSTIDDFWVVLESNL